MASEAFLNPLISGLVGLSGVWLGGWLSDRRDYDKRRTDFVKQQLSEFYGPLASMHAEIKARSTLRVKIGGAASAAWPDLIEQARQGGIEEMQRVSAERRPAFSALILDDNQAFREILMPIYRQMLALFRDKIWLAEPQTRTYFTPFVEFIDVWERVLRDALPGEVIAKLDHGEATLHPFYDHLEITLDRLRGTMDVPRTHGSLKRGLLRVWLTVSLIWIVASGAFFLIRLTGGMGGNPFDRFDDWYWPTTLAAVFIPPIIFIVAGFLIKWIRAGFHRVPG